MNCSLLICFLQYTIFDLFLQPIPQMFTKCLTLGNIIKKDSILHRFFCDVQHFMTASEKGLTLLFYAGIMNAKTADNTQKLLFRGCQIWHSLNGYFDI